MAEPVVEGAARLNTQHIIKMSPPLDFSIPYDVAWVKDRVILITGGASGFGAAFVRKWATNGATVIMGDINTDGGSKLAAEVNSSVGRTAVYFIHANVLDWQSMVSFFKKAVELSPTGGIDTVVANAGIANVDPLLTPKNLDAAEPPPPDLRIAQINYFGVLYTVHLALFWLPRNPTSNRHVDLTTHPTTRGPRDRHILLLGSMASIGPLAPQPQYTSSKHAVLGLFRALRSTCFVSGIRINMVCPYFIDTPIVPVAGRIALAGGATGKVEDVVDAASRFVSDPRVVGRAIVVGPKVKLQQNETTGEFQLVQKGAGKDIPEQALWEAYADDWEDTELMSKNFLEILHAIEKVRGWGGWAYDIVMALRYGVRQAIYGKGK
ncbi:NAD(P)-binding protein [Pseudovirgaria hyperparasitica]|uniref:NAD(P)-binding protein n=1 Tax=Pseudovirgaria hyperparasitica TaxID=470096 RepID=A0A6A6W523_9PEZI|nr:NAD(P)-binding protein [Pseudovirgaria hyperparasitica]KAF2757693.1 NAD(P)-binding protein [Pseudovirgaria hyperparasitica]